MTGIPYTITKYAKARVLFNDGGHQVPQRVRPATRRPGVCRWDGGDWSCGDSTIDGDNDGVPDVLDMMLGAITTPTVTDCRCVRNHQNGHGPLLRR